MMDEEDANSWLWRAKFSNTVCHRIESSRFSSIPSLLDPEIMKPRRSPPSDSLENRNASSNSPNSNHHSVVSPPPTAANPEKKIFLKLIKEFQSMKMCKALPEGIVEPSRRTREKSKNKKRVNAVEAPDELSINKSQLYLGDRFAAGAHSKVYHGVYKGQPVAVKIVRIPDDDDNGALAMRLSNQFNNEAKLLSNLTHPNVIKLIAACRENPVYCIITEYLSEGSLRSYMNKVENKALPMKTVIKIALDIACGMEYVHEHGIIHRDLKPENVIIDENFNMKLADFGIACKEEGCALVTDDPGTYRWMAPEMIKSKPHGRKVDVYSFGLILWELFSGQLPYGDKNPIQAAFAVVNKDLRPEIAENCPTALRELIEKCWDARPEKRPEFSHIVNILRQFASSLS